MRWPWSKPTPRMVRAHIQGQEFSLEGILVGEEAAHYKLANASHIESAEKSWNLPGVTWVPRERVLYLQEVAG
jgi:hypothetical protein